MSAEDKMRTSGEALRDLGSSSSASVLPTVSPEAEKTQAPKSAIPAAAYVVYDAHLPPAHPYACLLIKWLMYL